MKKKLIEAMEPPILTPEMKEDDYAAVARNPEKGILCFDIVNTLTEETEVRVCLTEKEYGNYYPETGCWDGRQIDGILTATISAGDIEYLEIHKTAKTVCKYETMHAVLCEEGQMAREKFYRAQRRKGQNCMDRNNRVKPPEKRMKNWLTSYVGNIHYIYYKRKGKRVQISCSNCGQSGTFLCKPETYEDWLRKGINFTPSHNMGGEQCPMCKTYGQWKAAGKTRGVYGITDHRYIVDNIDGTVVVRYFMIEKYITGTEQSASEDLSIIEVARNWFINNRIQRDYHKLNNYTGQVFWDYCNLSGNANIIQRAGKVRLKTPDVLNGTPFEYSGLEKQIRQSDYTDAVNYLRIYMMYPMIEMLDKLGMENLLCDVKNTYGYPCGWINRNGKRPQDIFRITKQRFNDLRIANGGVELLRVFQYENSHGIRFSDSVVKKLEKMNLSQETISTLREYGKFEKTLNYVIRQQEREPERNKAAQYSDYIMLLKQNNRLMTERELYPRSLTEAHNRELTLKSEKKTELELQRLNKKNPGIKKDAAEYNRRYKFQNADYVIRAPKDAGEIYMEGLLLNHCVGRMGYIEAMNRKETLILFLRKKRARKEPYYTIEVKDGQVRQAYGYGDKRPDWEQVGPFIEEFKRVKLEEQKEERKVG